MVGLFESTISGFKGAVGTLKVAADLAVAIGKLNTLIEVKAKAIELQQVILSAQSEALAAQAAQFGLLDRIRELETELADSESREAEKQRYRLHQPVLGKFVYALKPECHGTEPPHWICAPCHEDGKKSILHLAESVTLGKRYVCPKCETTLHTGDTHPAAQSA